MTTVQGQLLGMLETVAKALGDDLRKRMVFVGGCTTALFITDEIVLESVRTTDDVDLIVDLVGRAQWAQLQDQLRQKGFTESPEDDVICRMRLGDLKVDFMPDDESILGFSNRWYANGIETAVTCSLTDALNIKRLTPELFVATKLEAYLGRGNDDPLGSRDLEDILLVVDGREELAAEIQHANDHVRRYIAEQFKVLLSHDDFDHFVEGNIKGPEGRVDIVRERIVAISRSDSGS
jgi:predicted nucleotidyltransferase